jgi:hypothetical protein
MITLLILLLILFLLFLTFVGGYIAFDEFSQGEIVVGICGIFLFLVGFLPLCYIGHEAYIEKTTVQQEQKVYAKVINVKYQPSYTSIVMSGKVAVPITHAESYNIELQYEDVKETIDNKQLFEQVKINEKIEVKLIQYISGNKILKQELKIN